MAMNEPQRSALEAYCNAAVRIGKMNRGTRRDILTLAGVDLDGDGDD